MSGLKKQRLTTQQICLLETEFQKNNNWTKSDIKALAERLNFIEYKIYKWHWDRLHR